MRHCSKRTSVVSLARIPSLSSLRPARNPGVPRSTTKAEMPLAPRVRSVTAITTITSALAPCVMNVFAPFSTQQSPSRVAVVRVAAASLPAFGSVSAQAPSFSPRASGTSHFCFCASVPNIAMCAGPRPLWAATDSETDGSTRASSSMQRQ